MRYLKYKEDGKLFPLNPGFEVVVFKRIRAILPTILIVGSAPGPRPSAILFFDS